MGWKQYCSHVCLNDSKLRGKEMTCSRNGCNKYFYRQRSDLKKVEKTYCSRKCAALVNNRNKPPRLHTNWHSCGNKTCGKMIAAYMMHCSKSCRTTSQIIFSNQELKEKILLMSQKLGRSPAKRELGNIADMCIRAFGSWNTALEKVGLIPHRSHSQRMYKRTKTTALDGHACDSISEALIDNWLTEHEIPHDRNAPYPGTNHKADWQLGKKLFIEYFGLANDSPRYDRSIREKRRLCRQHAIRLIEIYPQDLYPVIKLEKKLG